MCKIFDSCANVHTSLYSTLRILSGTEQVLPNYRCWNRTKVMGFIGDLSTTSSHAIAQLAGIYRYPQLNSFLQRLLYNTSSGDTFYFKSNRQVPTHLDFLKTIFKSLVKMKQVKVGSYDEASTLEFPFNHLDKSEVWAPYFQQAPQSLCTEPCRPGYRRAKRQGEPPCCYHCVLCPRGEMSNTTGPITGFLNAIGKAADLQPSKHCI
ncbi:uncharacterized protein [Engystomops pustulosus]|uniref:uncharacterized protein n=1 Tax=Engystomops pustulosus TaxID=76066 RepID=UPI003AFAC523